MMGGGFGGCTINIVKKESVKDFLAVATVAYQKEFKIDAEVIEVEIGDGTHKLDSGKL
jgi:galactokinase